MKSFTLKEAFADMLNTKPIEKGLKAIWRFRLKNGGITHRLMAYELRKRGYREGEKGIWI